MIEQVPISVFMTIVVIVAGFLFSSVAGYMAGLVGSSNNPISGVTIATILCSALSLAALLGSDATRGPAAAIMIGAVVCCAAAIAGDNMQDLKCGHILGATPRKQQFMQMVGVVAAAAVMAPILSLLLKAYGFGPKTAANPDALAAPQATLMQSVAEGVFGGGLPWNIVSMGAIIGALVIACDQYLKSKNSSFRTPVLAVAVGLYLPFELDSTILIGGLIAYFAGRKSSKPGLLFASGLITGEALMGILLAIPFAIAGRNDVFAFMSSPIGSWPGLLVLIGITTMLYRYAKKA